jgi:uncharacterized membrane protein
MGKATNLLAGFSAGAVFMYMTDPDRGRRRRALIRDKAARTVHTTQRAVDKTGRDISNRAHGLAAMARSIWGDQYVEDDVIVARVRAKIGRVVSHPHAIHVRSERGRLILEGPVLDREYHTLLSAAESAAEGMEVDNRLERHAEADISALQGGPTRSGERWELMQTNWTPAVRTLAGIGGTALLIRGIKQGGFRGAASGVIGSGILLRAASNMELRRALGVDGARAVDLEKTVNIHAPVPDVFAFWSHYANFPRFMTHLRQVRDLGNNRSAWTAEGPLGIPVSWSAEITERVENKSIAWRSLPGAYLENSGVVRFDPNPDGGTRITIRMSYAPPMGVLGHALARLFGADPKRDMDEDFVRLKSLIEHGKTRAHGGIVHREQLGAPSPL